jgi:hypothetical protein
VRTFNPIIAAAMRLKPAAGGGERAWLGRGLLAGALLAGAGIAQAQTTSPTALPGPADDSLTWHGITLYGIIDMDYQYETHGAPFSNYFISGGADIVQKNSNNAVQGFTSNGMSQSRVGLQGKESLHFGDWSGVFKLETYFNPASGQITDALKSVTQNNGRALDAQSTNIDSSIAGQPFEQAFVGISSKTWGTFTFGRQNSTLADLIAKYDPQQTSYAFSLLGLSGTPAGGGDTQDRRLDRSSTTAICSTSCTSAQSTRPRMPPRRAMRPAVPARRSPPLKWRWVRSMRARRPMCSTPRSRMRFPWAR